MKKGILLLGLGILLAGLVFLVNKGLASSKEKVALKHEKQEVSLTKKEFLETGLILVDSRNGKAIQKLKASSFTDENDAQVIAEQLETKYDRPMIPAKLGTDGSLKGGHSRIVLDKDTLLKNLENVTAFQKEVKVPISESKPNVTADSIKGIDQSIIGSYTTNFNPSVTGRTTNIQLSANILDGVILGPGDRLYFNQFVGERTPARGYQKAKEIVNKEFIEGIGGGICQTSSTLFNAVDKAGLKILQRSNHSKSVGYVPVGRDATVSWGGKDFKFENSKPYPVMIRTDVNRQNGTVTVQVTASPKHVATN
ncbi:VanW family protein [Bacillus sp. V59.32b]|uniref:VanW family protein n=1 Tax=Bacillus sp. V59.32b TaxID=1758642 RepID=UPI000E3CC9E5|nr:VanW family protein [Bacillus sp. V59.32b]RFU62697.1 vanomycin resistance protein VanB [Bacillus sp. V59.32b]